MNKTNFEDLEIWKMGNELVYDLGKIFYDKNFKVFDFQSQMMRAVMSITNNIAEGYERGSNKEFIHFLYYSKGSCGEVRSMLYSAMKFNYIDEKQFTDFKYRCMTLSTKIYNFIKYLKEKTKDK
ncbi:MAG: four helix bundle protein [Candidatus Absconditabacterales bacterium]